MHKMEMAGKAKKIASAQERMPKDAKRQAPAGPNGPGPEKKADMKGAMGGDASNGLRGAVNELKTQHPIRYDYRGPHHGGKR